MTYVDESENESHFGARNDRDIATHTAFMRFAATRIKTGRNMSHPKALNVPGINSPIGRRLSSVRPNRLTLNTMCESV
jgi:hypothetical protein